MLVWCGNGHHTKCTLGDWKPMGYQFHRLSGIEPFVIDQTITVVFDAHYAVYGNELLTQYRNELVGHGGTAGVLVAESPAFAHHKGSDAVLLSLDNDME